MSDYAHDVEAHCCQRMVDAVTSECEQHPDRFDCPDALLDYFPKFREYGLIIHDGGASVVRIAHCPWCGVALPSSLRDEWFERIAQLGLEPDSPFMPAVLRSDEWWSRSA